MDGVELMGCALDVRLDPNSQDGSKIIVNGFPEGVEWQELKDHFAGVGTIAFVRISGHARHGARKAAEVRFASPKEARQA